jgi:hypothetical protein
MKKKIFITHHVKDLDYWLANNSMEKTWGAYGIKFRVFLKQNKSNFVGVLAEIENYQLIEDLVTSTTLFTSTMKADGVLMETIEIMQAFDDI